MKARAIFPFTNGFGRVRSRDMEESFSGEQAVRSSVAQDLARKDRVFVRDAFHLSGARPWLWHVFVGYGTNAYGNAFGRVSTQGYSW